MPIDNPFGQNVPSDPFSRTANGLLRTAQQQAGQDPAPQTDYSKAFGEDNALPGQRYYDPRVDSELTNPQLERLGFNGKQYKTGDYYSDFLNEGVPKGGLDTQGAGLSASEDNDPMGQAIRGKAQRDYSGKISNLKNTIEANRTLNASNELTRTGNILGAEEQLKIQNHKEQYAYQQQRIQMYNQWINAQQQAKAQFFGSIFGFAGTAGAVALA